MKKTIAICAILMLVGLLPATKAHAWIITELSDFSDDLNAPSPLGSLDLGINTVSGSLSGEDYNDWFSFEADPGHEIVGIDLTISNYQYNPISFVSVYSQLYREAPPSVLLGNFSDLHGNVTVSFNSAIFPLGADSYTLGVFEYDDSLNTRPFDSNSDWQFDITVSGVDTQPIPAPGAILLGSIGVGLISWLRRRRKL